MRFRPSLLATGVLALCATAAQAQLVLVSPIDFQGSGLGSVNTILTITSPGSSAIEAGTVSWNGTADVKTGDYLSGASQTLTRSFADLGVSSADSLRVVFNALEPGGAANAIDLTGLTLGVYNAAGAQVFSAAIPQTYGFADTFTGAGNSGFVFGLTSASVAQLASVFSSNLRVGLTASAANASGGFETFFVGNAANTPVTPVPEPGTYALMFAGLSALGFIAHRRRRSA